MGYVTLLFILLEPSLESEAVLQIKRQLKEDDFFLTSETT